MTVKTLRFFCLFFLINFTSSYSVGSNFCLFKGKNLSNWNYECKDSTAKDSMVFHVKNKTIRAYGKHQAYLISKKSYKNYFELTMEFRWDTDSTLQRLSNKRNSGVMYNVLKNDTSAGFWPKGVQFQLKDKATGDFVLMGNVTLKANNTLTTPGRSVTVKRRTDAEKPVGEWNSLRIVFNHGHCRQYLNGVLVNEGTEVSVSEGYLLLQYEGYPINFRKIKVKTK